jgi:hypothetical protein
MVRVLKHLQASFNPFSKVLSKFNRSPLIFSARAGVICLKSDNFTLTLLKESRQLEYF